MSGQLFKNFCISCNFSIPLSICIIEQQKRNSYSAVNDIRQVKTVAQDLYDRVVRTIIENQNQCIYIKSGESKNIADEVAIVPFVPKGLEHTYQYGLGWVMSDYSLAAVAKSDFNDMYCGKLHLSEDNILSLDSDFSFDDIENAINSGKCSLTDYEDYSGNMDNLRGKDTIRIGTLAILLLPTDGLYYNTVKEQYGAEYAALMNRGLTGAVVYWVKE